MEKIFSCTISGSCGGIWEDGYNGSVIICNTGDKVIENWELSYQTRDEYTSVWNARMSYHADGFYDIKNDKSNADIEPGQEMKERYNTLQNIRK